MAAHPEQVASIRAGKEQVLGFLVGQIMKATRGKANPQLVNEVLRERVRGGGPA
jgi:aspartyl-tRNA(Asn)/glutamyl-tRNA(Gln) amidotransferase subunit B